MRPRVEFGLVCLACAGALAAAACSSGTHARDGAAGPDGTSPDVGSPDGALDVASPEMCGADIPPGQACNALANLGTAITPTCATGTAPTGSGGVVADGTYVLTAQTLYDPSCSSPPSLSETIMIAGDCVQVVFGGLLSGTVSGRRTNQGSGIGFTMTCQHIDIDGTVTNMPFAMQTYTATSTTLTLFDVRSTGATEVAVFTKR